MALQLIYSGSKANDNTGNLLRDSCIIINSNFQYLSQSISDYSFPYTGSGIIKGTDLHVTGSITSKGYELNKIELSSAYITNTISASNIIVEPNYALHTSKLTSAVDPTTYIQFFPDAEEVFGTTKFFVEGKEHTRISPGSIIINQSSQPFLFHVGGYNDLNERPFTIKGGITDEDQYVLVRQRNATEDFSNSGYSFIVAGDNRGNDSIVTLPAEVIMANLPTTDPGVNGEFFTQTATELGGSGDDKILCISTG